MAASLPRLFGGEKSKLLAGTLVGVGCIAFMNQKEMDFKKLSTRINALLAAVKSAELYQASHIFDIYSALSSGGSEQAPSVSLCLQLSAIPYAVDMLWGSWLSGDTKSVVEILKVIADASPANASSLLSRAPTINALSEVASAAGLSRAQISKILLTQSKLKSHNAPIKDFGNFIDEARGEDSSPIPPELVLFFVLTHSESVPRSKVSEVTDLVTDAFLADMMRSKQAFVGIVDAFLPFLSQNDKYKLIPILLKAIGGNSTGPLIGLIRKLLLGRSVSIDQSLFNRLFEISVKRPDSERELLELAGELLVSDPRLSLPQFYESKLIARLFALPEPSVSMQRVIMRCLSAGASRSVSPLDILRDTVPLLEKTAGLSDYELSQRKKLLEDAFSRPLDDSELYAFHDEPEHQFPQADSHHSEESLAQRIAILTEVMRHKLMEEKASDFKNGPQVLLSVIFPLLTNRILNFSSSESEREQIVRALANISTLARAVGVNVRNRFLAEARKCAEELKSAKILSVYGQAELRRLEHNLRCIPVKSAPMLIDSFLPLSRFTPADANVDIVFVHGLRGGLHSWRYMNQTEKTSFEMWPEACLGPSFPQVRLLAFTYEAPLWYATHKQHYSEVDVKRNFKEMALGLKAALADAGVGRNGKKVVFVSFSMGGLVTKQALLNDRVLRDNTLGIIFFATPHLGSPIADYAYYSPLGGLVSPFVADLSRKSKQVALLHESFTELCGRIPSLSVCESAPSDLGAGLKSFVVPFESCSACKSGKVITAGEGIDHEAVSKIRPELGIKDPRVAAILEFLNSVIDTN
jgi:pimeloyl-ACP methyl ester carboxylesterase